MGSISLKNVIASYHPRDVKERKEALREVVQELILVALSKADFFNKAGFYGGTALRIFYGLNRFSEDLDFTLLSPDENFTLEPYLPIVTKEAGAYDIVLETTIRVKSASTPLESAFAKCNTYQTFLNLHFKDEELEGIHHDEVLKVKFEVDRDPALGFETKTRYLDIPEFARVNVLDESSLFAGKIHAVLCRNHKNNVKGRDYFDFLFFLRQNVKPNMVYLRNKLIHSGKITADEPFDMERLRAMLREQFESVDFAQARQDMVRFVSHDEDLSYYNKDLFIDMLRKLN